MKYPRAIWGVITILVILLISLCSDEARSTLRHYELVGVLRDFTPRVPLRNDGTALGGPAFYHAAITDWCVWGAVGYAC